MTTVTFVFLLSGALAEAGKRVKVLYVGKLKTTGKVFDQSGKKGFSFRLGTSEVIAGNSECNKS